MWNFKPYVDCGILCFKIAAFPWLYGCACCESKSYSCLIIWAQILFALCTSCLCFCKMQKQNQDFLMSCLLFISWYENAFFLYTLLLYQWWKYDSRYLSLPWLMSIVFDKHSHENRVGRCDSSHVTKGHCRKLQCSGEFQLTNQRSQQNIYQVQY